MNSKFLFKLDKIADTLRKDDVIKVAGDILKVAGRASSTFLNTLSEDEIQTCFMNATWKAINTYDHTLDVKFTTYLYRGMVMECLTQQKFNLKSRLPSYTNIPDPIDYTARSEMLDLIQTCDDPDLIYDRYYKNMTIKELALQRGVCGETVRIRIKKNLKKLKSHLV